MQGPQFRVLPATHARNSRKLRKAFESKSVLRVPRHRPRQTPSGACSRWSQTHSRG